MSTDLAGLDSDDDSIDVEDIDPLWMFAQHPSKRVRHTGAAAVPMPEDDDVVEQTGAAIYNALTYDSMLPDNTPALHDIRRSAVIPNLAKLHAKSSPKLVQLHRLKMGNFTVSGGAVFAASDFTDVSDFPLSMFSSGVVMNNREWKQIQVWTETCGAEYMKWLIGVPHPFYSEFMFDGSWYQPGVPFIVDTPWKRVIVRCGSFTNQQYFFNTQSLYLEYVPSLLKFMVMDLTVRRSSSARFVKPSLRYFMADPRFTYMARRLYIATLPYPSALAEIMCDCIPQNELHLAALRICVRMRDSHMHENAWLALWNRVDPEEEDGELTEYDDDPQFKFRSFGYNQMDVDELLRYDERTM